MSGHSTCEGFRSSELILQARAGRIRQDTARIETDISPGLAAGTFRKMPTRKQNICGPNGTAQG